MKVTIDRFEDEYAVVELETGEMVNIPKVLIPDASEGDIISITIEKKETEDRKNYIKMLRDSLLQTED